MFKSACALLASASVASAQSAFSDFGSWETLTPVGGVGPVGFASHTPTVINGAFLINGVDPVTLGNTTYSFDINAGVWTQYPDLPNTIQHSFLTSNGGWIIQFPDLSQVNGNQIPPISYISSTSIGGNWKTVTIGTSVSGNTPSPRYGYRILEWGGETFIFGGVSSATSGNVAGLYYNDMYSIDVDALTAGNTVTWTLNMANGTVGAPEARAMASFDAFGTVGILFGGISTAAGVSLAQCFPGAPIDPSCHFHSSVWYFTPGQNPNQPLPQINGTNWNRMTPMGIGANGPSTSAPVPSGRFGHATGRFGSFLYIFGGIGQSGLLNDMWVNDIAAGVFWPVAQTANWPPVARGGFGGAVLGRHFYLYVSQGPQGPDQLMRWSHNIVWPSGGASNTASPDKGHVAGFVIAILLLIANAAVIFYVWKHGSLPGLLSGNKYRSAETSDNVPDVYSQLPGEAGDIA